MREKLKSFLHDHFLLALTCIDIVYLITMPLNPLVTYDFFFYGNLVCCIFLPFVAVFYGNKGIWCIFFIITNINAIDITFDDFTALSAMCILFLFIPKGYIWLRIITCISYLSDIFIAASCHKKEPYFLFVHLLVSCVLILCIYTLKKRKPTLLDLTNSEINILNELVSGKYQKEIEFYSETTITNKLKEAKKRNSFKNTDELLTAYRKTLKNL